MNDPSQPSTTPPTSSTRTAFETEAAQLKELP